MKKEDFINSISFLNDETKVGAKLYFHYLDGNKDIVLEAPTDNTSVDKKLSKIYSESILEKFKKDFELQDISNVEEFDSKTTFYFYESKYPKELKFLFEEFTLKYNFKKHEYSNIKGYIVNLNYGKNNLTIYKYRHNYDIHIKPTLLTLVKIDNELTSPSNESIIINEKFDYLISDKYLVASSLSMLERKLKFNERVNKQSTTLVQSLIDSDVQILEDVVKIRELLNDDFGFAKKMKPINFKGLLWNTPIKKLKKKFKNHPKLLAHLKFNNDETMFKITSKQGAKIFLSLCNDKVMESILSGDVHLVDDVENITD